VRERVPHAKVVGDRTLSRFPLKWDLADERPPGMTAAVLRQIIGNVFALDLEEAVAAAEAITLPHITSSTSGNGKAPMSARAKERRAEAKRLADKYCNPDGSPLTKKQIEKQIAALDDVDYDRARRSMARGAGVRTTTLDGIRARARATMLR